MLCSLTHKPRTQGQMFLPMMFMVVEGLDNLGTRASKAMSRRWAHRWVKSNYDAFKAQGFMFEKYFCEEFGSSAGACPSRTAVGYGWSNAVIIEFLCKYGREISMSKDKDNACQCRAGKTSSRGPASSSKRMDRKSCTCSTNKSTNCGQVLDDCSCAPVVPKPPPKQCCCCAGSRAQEVPTCSCSIPRNQMVPVRLESEHYPDCPCYKQKQSKCSCKHKEKVLKQPKLPKQKDLEANLKRQTDSDRNSPIVSDVHENIKEHTSSKDLKDLKEAAPEEQQKLTKKQSSSEEQEKSAKRAKSKESLEPYGQRSRSKDQKEQCQEPCLSEEDRERERLRREANLGHYAPLSDEIVDDCKKEEPKKERCCDCNDESSSEDDFNS